MLNAYPLVGSVRPLRDKGHELRSPPHVSSPPSTPALLPSALWYFHLVTATSSTERKLISIVLAQRTKTQSVLNDLLDESSQFS